MDVDIPIIGAMYCFLVIIVGQFFLLNLILAVIIESFMRQHEQRLFQEIKALEENNSLNTSSYLEQSKLKTKSESGEN
jgi:hypothetical protein